MNPLFLLALILIPLMAWVFSLFIPAKSEGLLSCTAFFSVGLHLLLTWATIVLWFLNGHQTVELKQATLYNTEEYAFYTSFYFDKISAVYLFVGSLITFLITIYCRYYMHRENGYKRFFNTVLLFYLGYTIVVLSGNLETLFIGWEILGISSFLLIAFYRDRYLPVKNAVKVFSIYRIGDVGIILAIWLNHHFWDANVGFSQYLHTTQLISGLQHHHTTALLVSTAVLITAAAKSAQLPFSSWLPRAMEGPTPSSAIFYGSLTVHLGAFLLLRTFPFWEQQPFIRVIVIVLGLASSVLSAITAQVQSSVKSQIAYSSITQIGIIFIEIAAGFNNLALFHFAGNAFLRTYQLLVSPSVVSYLIREQFYHFNPRPHILQSLLPKKIYYSLYLLSIKEWNLGALMNRLYWTPLKKSGRRLSFINPKVLLIVFLPLYLIAAAGLPNSSIMPHFLHLLLPALLSFIGLAMVLRSFIERHSAKLSWALIIMGHFWTLMAVAYDSQVEIHQALIYLSGVIVAGITGYLCLNRMTKTEHLDLDRFSGHVYEHPKLAFIFLLSCLGLAGFPISPTFLGEDLLFSFIHEDQMVLAFFFTVSIIVNGLSLMRLYSRIFMGPHIKTYHELAYKSS